jgi:hypothetical protein
MTRHKKYDVDAMRPGADKEARIKIANPLGTDIIERSMVSHIGSTSNL